MGLQNNCIKEWYTPIKSAGQPLALEGGLCKASCEYAHFVKQTP